MSLPRISQVIRELEKIQAREGDLPVSCDGFFGECAGVKVHLKHQAANGHFWSAYVYPESDRREKIVQLTHL